MFAYFKAEPTEYVLAYSDGRVFQQGAGRAFWYWRPSASIVVMPVSTIDALFALNETTRNFQAVTVQGQVTYRIADPRTRKYRSDDPAKLEARIVNVVQTYTRNELHQLSLEDALRAAEPLAR